jgi:pimeloyl-ACP methyl ester carboxylesterase
MFRQRWTGRSAIGVIAAGVVMLPAVMTSPVSARSSHRTHAHHRRQQQRRHHHRSHHHRRHHHRPSRPSTQSSGNGEAGVVRTSTVCFEVHNGVNQARVLGTRYQGPQSDLNRVIVLVHGHSVNSHFWDLTPSYSVARNLARAGYLVVAYDQLGIGRSTYVAPDAVTFDADRAMVSEIVQQIKGTYPFAVTGPLGSCPEGQSVSAGSHPKVVLIGHSAGGDLVSGYPALFGSVAPIDAVVQAENSVSTSTYATNVEFDRGLSSKNIAGGWVSLFLDDGSTPSSKRISTATPDPANPPDTTCQQNIKLLLYPGIKTAPSLFDAVCDPATFELVAYNRYLSEVDGSYEHQALVPLTDPRLPVLLARADHDGFCPPGPCQDAEVQLWSGKNVTLWTEHDTGHAFIFSSTMPTFTDEVSAWLHAHGI